MFGHEKNNIFSVLFSVMAAGAKRSASALQLKET
jgi:hypothetical protein